MKLPFSHTGIEYTNTDHGRKMAQDEFCQKVKPFSLSKARAKDDDSPLTAEELTGFRAILGALLWLCQTRLDIIADVVLAQQEI